MLQVLYQLILFIFNIFINKIRSMDLNTFIQNNLPLFERYILAEDKQVFLNKQLTVPQDRKIFDFLLSSLSDKDKELVKEFRLSSEAATQLLNSKTIRELDSVKDKEEQIKIIDKIKKISNQFFFDFPKPVEINQVRQTGVDNGEKSESVSKQIFDTEKTVQEVIQRALKEDPSNFFKLSHYGLKNLPTQYLSNLKENQFQFLFQKTQILRSMNPEGVAQFISNLIKKVSQQKKSSVQQEFPEQFFSILSFEQVQALRRKNPKLIDSEAYHMKMFRLKYESQFKKVRITNKITFQERQQKRKLCLQAIQYVNKQNKVFFEYLKQKLVEEILLIDEINVDSKLGFFVKYLTDIKSIVFRSFEPQFEDRIKSTYGRNKYQNRRHVNLDFLYSSQFNQSQIINRTIVSLFRNWDAEILPQLSKYIERTYLIKQQALGLLSKGKQKQVSNILEIFTSSQLNALKEKKQITFLDSNKNIFKPKDSVILEVKIKNISKILKKIYTVDLQKLLLENNRSIDNDINLKFLVPEHQEVYEIKSSDSFEEVKEQLKFPQLQNKLGQFIIEIQGDGILSRAIVRKGKIVVENTLTSTGHELTFYDQEGKQIPQLSIWRNSKKFIVKQSYKIPYGPQGTERIITAYNGHAQAHEILIQTQGYSFQCEYLYHSETFIVGNKAKVIIHPVLKLNGEHASPSRIRNLSINVTSINNQNISSSQLYQNITFKQSQEYILEYPIKAYIKSFRIQVSGQIELINKQILKVKHQKKIEIDLQESNNNFVDLYLEKSYEGNYRLKIRGKNGQAIPNSQAVLSYEQFGLNFAFSKQLTSDEKGEILLGKLSQVTNLIVTVASNGFNSKRSWKLNNFGETISYGSLGHAIGGYEVYLQEGDNFSLPLPSELSLETDLILEKMNPDLSIYYDLTNTIKLSNDRLLIENLQLGSYTLILLRYNRKIQISVLKAKIWNKNKLIDGNNTIYALNKKNDYISLGEIIAETKEDHIQCSIMVNTSNEELPNDLRIHIFAKNYIDSSNIEIINLQNRLYCNIPQKQKLILNETSYLQNKTLSDQISYALNRRNQQIANGNNLEKPHVFLKRIEVRDTVTKDQVLNKESSFRDRKMYGDQMFNMSRNCAAPRMMACAAPGHLYGANLAYAYPTSITTERFLNSHNNFFYKVGHLNHNIKNLQKFKVPRGYNQVDVYLFSKNIVLKRQYSIPEGNESKLKLTHSSIADINAKQGWTMSRQIYKVQRNERRQISRNSTWTTVSLENIAKYASLQGITLPEWILGWKNYSNQKKLEIYDKEVCHELNFFIYRHDKEFFKSVVHGFISNKLNKTFVDNYLLDKDSQLKEYNNTYQLRKLNTFEKVLLIEKFKEYGMSNQAQNLASSLQLPLKTTKLSNEQFKVFFQTLLNAKKQASQAPNPFQNPFYSMASRGGGGGFGGVPPPPPSGMYAMQSEQLQNYCLDQGEQDEQDRQCMMEEARCEKAYQQIEQAKQIYKPGFKQTEKTKQYTQTTYSGIVNQKTEYLISNNLFWAQLARHLCSKNGNQDFLTDKFNYLTSKLQFVLGCAFLVNDSQSDYELENSEKGYFITAKNSFLVFVREVKSLPFEPFKSVVLNQRFFDPKNKQRVDDQGQTIQREVQTFIIHKPYTIQTLVTNISSSSLELQILMDIPEGSIPLFSHEQTQIINISLPAYNTQSFERHFYFPEVGRYSFYPANFCRGKTIIAKSAQVQAITVHAKQTITKLQSFDNVLKSGDDQEILNFLKTKNIFNPMILDVNQILWKLKDKEFYHKVVEILKERKYYHPFVWSFSIYHNDFEIAKEFFESNLEEIPFSKIQQPILEYYPYYSRRVHKFANENKSTIRVKEFKDNYELFILSSIFNKNIEKQSTTLALIYYLLLQDRITEAKTIFKNLKPSARNSHKLQYDYIDCFLDMFDGSNNNYQIARKLSAEYSEYPVLTWRKLFKEVYDLLNKSQDAESDDSTKGQEVSFSTTVVNNGAEIKINRPSQGKVVVNLYEIDIQLYFSEFPFSDVTSFSAISPKKTFVFEGADFKVERLERKDYEGMKDIYVDIYEQKGNNALTKVTSFFWTNPDVKVKVNQKQGTLKVFYKNKKCPTSYCKIYSQGSKGVKFSRDGYTDIAATFRYALDVADITQFSILVLTQYGGSIHRVKPPVAN